MSITEPPVNFQASEKCIRWTGSFQKNGYGRLTVYIKELKKLKNWLAHRWIWTQQNGEIPDNLHVLHSCDNKWCVNIRHLSLGTHQENMRQRGERGRQRSGMAHGEQLPISKLNDEKVRQIRLLAQQGYSQRQLASRFAVGKSAIGYVLTKRTWNHVE